MWIYFSPPSFVRHPFGSRSSSRALSLFPVCPLRFPRSLFFIPSIHVIRIESFNKKFCSPAESAPFCEFKWKSGRESGRGWRPGGRRALLACKLKCCHLNANKTPPRAESSVEKEGGGQKRGRKRDRERGRGRATESSEGENGRKAGLDRSRDRGAYAVEEEISKRISLPSLSHVKLHPNIWRRPNLASLASYPYHQISLGFPADTNIISFIFHATLNCYLYLYI